MSPQPSYHPRYQPNYPSERRPQSTLSQINGEFPIEVLLIYTFPLMCCIADIYVSINVLYC